MIHHRKNIIGSLVSLLAVISFIAFYIVGGDVTPMGDAVSVIQLVSSPAGPTFSQHHQCSCKDFPQEESSRMVQQFVANLEQYGRSELDCSFSRTEHLGLDAKNTGTDLVDTNAIWPVRLTLSALGDGTTVLQNSAGQVLATAYTADQSILTDASVDSLHEAWTDCTSTIRK